MLMVLVGAGALKNNVILLVIDFYGLELIRTIKNFSNNYVIINFLVLKLHGYSKIKVILIKS